MTRNVSIFGLKHLNSLSFDVPNSGVHLLAGPNGAGKTTLLACLRRIAWPFAFQQHFASSRRGDQLDNFSTAKITYSVGDRSVTYAYAGERWVPTPRANSDVLGQFGFSDVLYVGATADRITPRPEDFEPRRVRHADTAIKDAANRIFSTQKFDALRTINLSRGVGNAAFLIQTAMSPQRAAYYSEKNFSLGELCVLKLVRDLQTIPRDALLLVDELELALHPRVQVELFNYVSEIAALNNLTVIFSTHSVSLLKSVDRNQILYLDNVDGDVSVVAGCFSTYALGGIAYEEERAPDVVVYVEDSAAVYVVEALMKLFLTDKFQNQGLYPTVQIAPVGPFMSVVRFLSHGRSALPAVTKCRALLDGDVRDETVLQWRANNRYALLAEFHALGPDLHYLPWTPEVGLVDYLSQHLNQAEAALRIKFGDQRIRVRPEDLGHIPAQAGPAKRKACKQAVSRMTAYISALRPALSDEMVERGLYEVFAEWHFGRSRPDVMQLFGLMIA